SDLRKPDAVIVDNTRLAKLFPGEDYSQEPKAPGLVARAVEGVTRLLADAGLVRRPTGPGLSDRLRTRQEDFYGRFLGRELEMNDRRAIIVGVCEATRTFQSNAVVYTTYSRAKRFIPQERKILSYVLAKVEGTGAPGLPKAAREKLRKEAADR